MSFLLAKVISSCKGINTSEFRVEELAKDV